MRILTVFLLLTIYAYLIVALIEARTELFKIHHQAEILAMGREFRK